MKPLSEQSPPPSSSIEFEPQWVARQRQLKNQRRSSEERSMSSYANSARSLLSLSLFQKLSILASLSLFLILFFNLKKKNQITERLRDPRGLRRGGFSGTGPRNLATNGPRQRGFLRPVRIPCLFPQKKKNWKEFDFWFIYLFGFQADRTDSDGQPPAKRRLSSAVVKVTKKTKHPLFRWWEFRKVTIWSYDVLLCCLWFDDKWVK